jgi:hypothetical protein
VVIGLTEHLRQRAPRTANISFEAIGDACPPLRKYELAETAAESVGVPFDSDLIFHVANLGNCQVRTADFGDNAVMSTP